MKVKRDTVQYEGNTEIKAKEFGITNIPVIADLLSNMYSDPILAVIREYVCNALDSHKDAGKAETPIKIVVPNRNHLYFEVHDEGLGLCEEGVNKLWATFGGTNKNDSNDLIGGFGIGSKAGFAYTNEFQVIARKDGRERTFLVYKSEKGPMIEKMMDIETDEVNGVIIKIPVKHNDIQNFHDKTIDVARWIDTTPHLVGVNYFDPVEFIIKRDDYGIIKSFGSNSSYNEKYYVKVKMGEVVYNTSIQNEWFNEPVILFCNIGDFNIAPDRESIILRTEDEDHIKQLCKDYSRIERAKAIASIQEQPTLFRAIKHHKTFDRSFVRLGVNFSWRRHKQITAKVANYADYSYQKGVVFGKSKVIDPTSIKFIFHTEGKTHAVLKRIKNAMIEHNISLSSSDTVLILNSKSEKENLKQWIKVGRPEAPIIYWSDVTDIKSTYVSRPVQMKKTRGLDTDSYFSIQDNVEVDLNDKAVRHYINIERSRFNDFYIYDNLEYFAKVAGINHNFYLVPKSLKKRIPDHWVCLDDTLIESWKEFGESANEYIKMLEICDSRELRKLVSLYRDHNIQFKGLNPLALKRMEALFEEGDALDKKTNYFLSEVFTQFADHFHYREKCMKIRNFRRKLLLRIQESYPLLSNRSVTYWEKDEIQYLDLMNQHVYNIEANQAA